jgi:hypothetical protein
VASCNSSLVDVVALPDFEFSQTGFAVLLNVDVDREMGVNIAHFVLVALCNTSDQVLDDRLDGAQRCDVLAAAVVDFNLDDRLLGDGECDGDVGQIFGELAS